MKTASYVFKTETFIHYDYNILLVGFICRVDTLRTLI
jgi:hypothetical protein